MSRAYRLDQLATALVPSPTPTFSWLLADLNEISNSYRVLSIRQISPAEEFLSEVERQYRLPKAWQRMLRPQREAATEAYLAEVEKLKRRAKKGGTHD